MGLEDSKSLMFSNLIRRVDRSMFERSTFTRGTVKSEGSNELS